MRLESKKLLEDVRQAAAFVHEIASKTTRSAFLSDLVLQAAIERKFEIMGEALNRLTKSDPELASRIREHRRIIAFRNLLIHAYDVVDENVVWDIVESKLPALLQDVSELLEDR